MSNNWNPHSQHECGQRYRNKYDEENNSKFTCATGYNVVIAPLMSDISAFISLILPQPAGAIINIFKHDTHSN